MGIALVLQLIQQAVGVYGAFKGTAAAAKLDAQVQDAASVITALTPLVQQFADGKEVTEDDVRAALAGKDQALAAFDAEIKRRGG